MSDARKARYEMAKLEVENKIKFTQEKLKYLTKELKHDKSASDLYTLLAVMVYHISIIEMYFDQNKIYHSFYDRNSEPLLDKIRKEFVSAFTLTGSFFGRKPPQTLLEPLLPLAEAQKITAKRLLNLFTKMVRSAEKLKKEYGINSRYVNSLADIYGDVCYFILHIVDFRYYFNKVRDLSDEEYADIKDLLDFVGDLLIKVTDNYKEAFNMNKSQAFIEKSLELLDFSEKYYRSTNDNRIADLGRKKEMWERHLNQLKDA
ncbi:MAG: hypothetical protein ACRCS8_01655 [Brevinema sp.]